MTRQEKIQRLNMLLISADSGLNALRDIYNLIGIDHNAKGRFDFDYILKDAMDCVTQHLDWCDRENNYDIF